MMRTYGHIVIFECPKPERAETITNLHAAGFYDTDGFTETGAGDFDSETTPDFPERFGDAMEIDAPGTTFMAWTEEDGYVVIRTPAIGTFTHNCDGDGDPVFIAYELRDMAKMTEAARERAMGTPWYEAIRKFH